MYTAITRILRAIHIIPPAKVDLVRTRPSAKKGEATATRPAEATVTAAPVNRDDTRKDVRKVEPAMDGIPGDAVLRMPRVASPGLPPVDPVVADYAARTSPPAKGANTRLSALAAHGDPTPESREPASTPMGSGLDSGSEVQEPNALISCRDVAGYRTPDPCADPSAPEAVNGSSQGSPKDQLGSVDEVGMTATAPFITTFSDAYEGAVTMAGKDGASDPGYVADGENRGTGSELGSPAGAPAAPIDSHAGDRLHRVETPTKRSPRVPPRIADRSRIEEWADDELLTLPEAAALFWPAGPITTNTLRTAERDGTLTVTKVAGKFFTTPMAIRRMGVDEVGEKAREPDRAEVPPQVLLHAKLAEAKRQGGSRKRPRRGA